MASVATTAHVPAVRFKGFDGDWEQRKLVDIAERVTRKNSELKSTLPLTISAQYGLVDQITFFNNRVAAKDVSNYYLIRKGEFAYNKSYSDGYPLGAVKRLDRYNQGVLSTLYILFSLKDVNSDFLVTYYDTRNWHKEITIRAAEGARNHGLLNISADDFFDTELIIPTASTEQQAIGAYFQNIDTLIALQQQKYEKLQNVKKAMLAQMFPAPGATTPAVRFAGFTAPWQVRRLASISTMHARIGWQNLRTSEFLDTGEYYLITGTDFIDGRIDFDNCHYVDQHRYKQDTNIQLSNGSILITKDGTLGKVAFVERLDKPATLNAGVFNVVVTSKDVDRKYLFQYLKAPFLMDYVDKRSTGGTIKHLNQNILVDFPVALPEIEEQRKIGNYFSDLDNLITLQKVKLEKLQNVKKACLEGMFV